MGKSGPFQGKRVRITRPMHGKITRDGKVSEPDIHWIVEKWLDRHPRFKERKDDIQVMAGQWTTADGLPTQVVFASILEGDDIAGYDPDEDIDLYEYYLAEDRYHQS